MSLYLEIARCLEGNFVPTIGDSPDQKNKFTLHSAIRTILGTNPDWSTLAYRNHAEISQFIQSTYQGLSETLGERSDTWCMRSVRTEEEVISLLTKAGGEIQLPVPPVPQVRPGMKKISGPSKSRGVIAAEIANIAHALGRGFADVFGDFLQPGISDLELIKAIDRRVVDIQYENDFDWTLPKKFSTVLPLWWRTSDSTVVSDFCYSMFDEWSGIQDQELDVKLDALVAESKRSIEPPKSEI